MKSRANLHRTPKKFLRKEGSDLVGRNLVKILPAPVHCLLLAQGLGRVFVLTSGHFFHIEPYAIKVAHTAWRVYLSTKTWRLSTSRYFFKKTSFCILIKMRRRSLPNDPKLLSYRRRQTGKNWVSAILSGIKKVPTKSNFYQKITLCRLKRCILTFKLRCNAFCLLVDMP